MDDFERVAILANEIQAQVLEAVLIARDIPHLIVSHHDSALDGVFQISQGWGHVKARAEHRDEVLNILAKLEKD